MGWIELLATAIGIGIVLVLWLRSRGDGHKGADPRSTAKSTGAAGETGEIATETTGTPPSLPERIDLGGARVTVPDGDGLTRLPAEGDDAGEPLKMRLWGLDAPEFPDQPFGFEARERLVSMLAAPGVGAIRRKGRRIELTVKAGVTATVHPAGANGEAGRDKYGRAVVTLHDAGGASINEALVRAGLAWPYFDRGAHGQAWQEAGAAKAGLLQEGADPIRPWEWRRRHPKSFSKTKAAAAAVPAVRSDVAPEPRPDPAVAVPAVRADVAPEPKPDPAVDAPPWWWPWAVVTVAVLVALVGWGWLSGG